MIYLKLFWVFFQIGMFSFGGGYASLPLIQTQVVNRYGWLNMREFADIVTISQMTPGPISINSATFVGTRIAGIQGAMAATFGCILPSTIIVLLISALYKKYRNLKYMQGILNGLHPAVVGLIASAGTSMIVQALWNGGAVSFQVNRIDFIAVALIALCVVILRKTKMDPVLVMLGAGVLGGVIYHFL